MTQYLKGLGTRKTSQTEAIPGTEQTEGRAGGFVWEIDDFDRLERFLILGSEDGTYYVGEHQLTRENAEVVRRCLDEDGERTVGLIVQVSNEGRAPKNDPAIFALAMAASVKDERTRQLALESVPLVCRTGTHLFQFVSFVEEQRGWGRGLRNAISAWYKSQDPDDLAYQMIKYRQRYGWTHRDVLRMAHPEPDDDLRNAIFRWGVDKDITDVPVEMPESIRAYGEAQASQSPEQTVEVIHKYGNKLPREAVKTDDLADASVWAALLDEGMPLTALIRNLATLTRLGLLEPMSDRADQVARQVSNQGALRKARVHPIQVLAALVTYRSGVGARGSNVWTPNPNIIDALDRAFYASFGNVQPIGKNIMLALDVSSSMTMDNISGIPGLTPREGSAAMALVTANVEPTHYFVGFQKRIEPLTITPKQRLDDVVRYLSSLPFGGTDCAQPMLHALRNGVRVDTFVVYTDNETWAGEVHPAQALREYRDQTGIPAKLVVVGMTADRFSIADPNDPGMMDVVGFDTATPNLISEFARQ